MRITLLVSAMVAWQSAGATSIVGVSTEQAQGFDILALNQQCRETFGATAHICSTQEYGDASSVAGLPVVSGEAVIGYLRPSLVAGGAWLADVSGSVSVPGPGGATSVRAACVMVFAYPDDTRFVRLCGGDHSFISGGEVYSCGLEYRSICCVP